MPLACLYDCHWCSRWAGYPRLAQCGPRLHCSSSRVSPQVQILVNNQSNPRKHRHFTHIHRLPDADVDHDVLKTDIQELQKLGAGGLEFLPFYNYGFGGVNDSKMETYAFGKPAFRDVLQIALEATKANGLSMDVALGASQGQGVPSKPLTPGLAVQLVYGKVSVKGGEKFDGALPAADINWNENLGYIHPQEKFGGSRLIGVSAAAVVSSKSSPPT